MKTIHTLILTAAFLTAGLAANAQSFTVHTKSGEAVTYESADVDSIVFHDSTTPDVVAPRIGDIYYSDGTWSTTLKADATPIGVVFCVGIASDYNDRAAYYTQKDGTTPMDEFHGYVVALKDATYADGSNDGVWWSAFDSNFEGTGASTSTADFLGYTNTQSIVATAVRDKGSLTSSTNNYPAAYYATLGYEAVCSAPEKSSGWFMPSAGQLSYIYNRVYFDEDASGRSCVANTLAALGEEVAMPMYTTDSSYWTSTEKIDSYGTSTWAYYYCFDSSMFNPGFIADYRKNTEMRVRSVLAF